MNSRVTFFSLIIMALFVDSPLLLAESYSYRCGTYAPYCKYNGNYYIQFSKSINKTTDAPMTLGAARATCVANRAHLATINSAAEKLFITSMFSDTNSKWVTTNKINWIDGRIAASQKSILTTDNVGQLPLDSNGQISNIKVYIDNYKNSNDFKYADALILNASTKGVTAITDTSTAYVICEIEAQH